MTVFVVPVFSSRFSIEMLIEACYVTNTGKVRRNNEDCLLLNETVVGGNMRRVECAKSEGDRLFYMVADGMGGHARGEVASSTVLTVFKERYAKLDNAEHITEALLSAKERLNNMAEKDHDAFGMGTTVTGMFFSGAKAFILNCGDSRVYGCGDRLRKLTKDHSLVQELVDSGTITEEEMRTHPRKNIITAALIGDSSSGLPAYSLEETRIMEGQKFLLCSDGLWESLSDRHIAECIGGKEIEEGAKCLFQQTLAAGASDNVSIILLQVTSV